MLHTTREKVLSLVNECQTMSQIGKLVGVSQQRVEQIIYKAGITKFQRKRKKAYQNCPVCKELFYPRYKEQIYCSMKCSRKAHAAVMVRRKCKICRKVFYVAASDIRPDKGTTAEFCSRKCRGKWLGINYGLRAKPENIRRN